ncbi:unnamed protein product [Ilex paraguariensis]|uniref:Putative plant transposon protein domain-containing protein n=1 Tax=Ilex paraguariensis TaxID=185542 RepID=A0ABC8TR60_9AQUA
MTEDRKKHRPKVVDNNREKMKRKKSCNDPPSIGPSSKKKDNHPPSTNPVDPTVDPSFNTLSSSNPISNLTSLSNLNPARSSNPICNKDISFFNKICKHRYDNCFYNKPLLLERGVLLDQLKDVGCDVIFAHHQWNSAVDIKKTDKTYNTLVKIFYSNMHDIDKGDHKFKSLVRNVKDVYAEIEGMPINFSESIDKSVFFQQDLTPKYRMLNLIMGYNISPRGHTADFGLDRAHLFYAIGNGICIDLPCLIVDEIISIQGTKDRWRCLSFPILISKIMEDCGVVIHSSDSYSTPMNPIYGGTIKKSLGQEKNKKTQQPQVEIQNEVATEDNIAAQDVPHSSTGGLPSSDDPPLSIFEHLLVQMGRKIEEFENTQNEIKESLKVINSRLDRIDNRWDRIESFFMKSKKIVRK